MARIVFVGRMLPGPSTPVDGAAVLGSPAAMRVLRYAKGSGPRTVKVTTAVTITDGGVTVAEDGIEPRVGEIWRIYTASRHQPFDTSICGGSRRISSAARVALNLWSRFPVRAKPRPIVPLGVGVVLDPSTGFPDDATKVAFDERRFALGTALPRRLGMVDHHPIISAAGAYRALRSSGQSSGIKVVPLIINAVSLGTATFMTDRGRRRLPAWQFSFKHVANPASVLAVPPPVLFTPPPLQQLGPPGTGNSTEDSATADRSGRRSRSHSPAPLPATNHATRVTPQAPSPTAAPSPSRSRRSRRRPRPGTICATVGYTRTTVLHLAKPLGARVLISSTDGGAIPVTR